MPISPLHNEKELLHLIMQGNEKAFRIIFDHYRTKIYAYAMHLTESADLADEAVQDVFMKLWLNKERLQSVNDFASWLHTIARNTIFDVLKQMAKEKKGKSKLVSIQSKDSDADTVLLDKENQQLLAEAIMLLTPQQQEVWRLSRQEGLKQEEIAQKLGISINTVKVHMVSALRIIRQYLDSHTLQALIISLGLLAGK